MATIVAAGFVAIGSAAKAEDACAPLQGFTLELTPVQSGYLVPIAIAGTPHRFLLEFDTAYTKLDEAVSANLKLPVKDVPKGTHISDASGEFTQLAIAKAIGIGPVIGKNAEFLIGSHRESWGNSDGVAGLNLFRGLDMELDLSHNRLGLYLPRKCDFQPFWPSEVIGEGEFWIEKTGSISLNMDLDGKKVVVKLASQRQTSRMPMWSAERLFGIKRDDPNLTRESLTGDGRGVYRYPFKKLKGGDKVTIENPDILIVDDNEPPPCNGQRTALHTEGTVFCFGYADLIVGLNVMRRLHLFFAMKQKKVYFTLADPTAGVSNVRSDGK